jgi:hypothetical protein
VVTVGQEGIPAVYSPIKRTPDGLESSWRAIVGMIRCEYGHLVCQRSLLIFAGSCTALASSISTDKMEPGNLMGR